MKTKLASGKICKNPTNDMCGNYNIKKIDSNLKLPKPET